MANNLGVDITGRFVVLREAWFKSAVMAADVRERVFRAEGGFGCSAFTMGTAVSGEFLVDGERTRIEGYDIERFATPAEVGAARAERARRSA